MSIIHLNHDKLKVLEKYIAKFIELTLLLMVNFSLKSKNQSLNILKYIQILFISNYFQLK